MSTPEAAAALETLRTLGFRLDSTTGAHRLIRRDGSQAGLYSLKGGFATTTGHLGNVTDLSADQAAQNAVPLAKAILADEAARLSAGNRKIGKSIESNPYAADQ
jgi:hypothetical protein